ncbi:MAG: hypothetical protein ACRD2L_18470, partial [Terriglobia bacterium]
MGQAVSIATAAGTAAGGPEEVDAIQVKLSQMELRRPRAFGNCWPGCEIWRLLFSGALGTQPAEPLALPEPPVAEETESG